MSPDDRRLLNEVWGQVSGIWYHWKNGDAYLVTQVVKNADTDEFMVIYRPLLEHSPDALYTRTVASFTGEARPGIYRFSRRKESYANSTSAADR